MSYRTRLVAEIDPRAPFLLALAARAQGWLALVGLVRLGTAVLDVIELVDEPHRRIGLVPTDDRLVIVHVALAAVVAGTTLAALKARHWIGALELEAPSTSELARAATLIGATVSCAVAALGAGGAVAAMLAWTPMSLYWLQAIAVQSLVYAVCAALVAVVTALAARAVRRVRVSER